MTQNRDDNINDDKRRLRSLYDQDETRIGAMCFSDES